MQKKNKKNIEMLGRLGILGLGLYLIIIYAFFNKDVGGPINWFINNAVKPIFTESHENIVVNYDDLYKSEDDIFYKRFNDTPFSGKVIGRVQTTIKNGKIEGEYLSFFKDGELKIKTTIKNGDLSYPVSEYTKYTKICVRGSTYCKRVIYKKFTVKDKEYIDYIQHWGEKNNKIMEKFSCKNGNLHGELITNHRFAGPEYRLHCKNGICNGDFYKPSDGSVEKVTNKQNVYINCKQKYVHLF